MLEGGTPVSFGGLYQRVSIQLLGRGFSQLLCALCLLLPFGYSQLIWTWICAAGLLYPMQVDVGVTFNQETPARFLQPHLMFLIPDAVYTDINPRAQKRTPPEQVFSVRSV